MNWDNKEEVLERIKKNGELLEFVSDRLKDNKEFILKMAKIDKRALNFATNKVKNSIQSL